MVEISAAIRPFYLPREFGLILMVLIHDYGARTKTYWSAKKITKCFCDALDQPGFILGDFHTHDYICTSSSSSAIPHVPDVPDTHLGQMFRECFWVSNKAVSRLVLNTGTPQGCVLSPLLFSIYTNELQMKSNTAGLFNYAVDMVLVQLCSKHQVMSE